MVHVTPSKRNCINTDCILYKITKRTTINKFTSEVLRILQSVENRIIIDIQGSPNLWQRTF